MSVSCQLPQWFAGFWRQRRASCEAPEVSSAKMYFIVRLDVRLWVVLLVAVGGGSGAELESVAEDAKREEVDRLWKLIPLLIARRGAGVALTAPSENLTRWCQRLTRELGTMFAKYMSEDDEWDG